MDEVVAKKSETEENSLPNKKLGNEETLAASGSKTEVNVAPKEDTATVNGTTQAPKRRKKKPRIMSSFQVFSKFIKEIGGRKTGEDILTAECFQLWMRTRDKAVLHPEESFRRTLIAHIRGAYGRKPFQPDVEASLLKMLRESEKNNEAFNVWERCFPANSYNIGKRGFNKLGYHETIAKKIAEQEKLRSREIESSYFVYGDVSRPMSSGSILGKHPRELDSSVDEIFSSRSQRPLPKRSHIHLERGSATLMLAQTQVVHNENVSCSGGLFDELISVLKRYYTDEELTALRQASTDCGFKLITPATSYFLNRTKVEDDPGFSWDLLIPPPPQRAFFSHKEVGKLLFDLKTWKVKNANVSGSNIWRRKIHGSHFFELIESPLEFLMAFTKFFPILKEYGEASFRSRVLLGDGTRAGLLFRIMARNDNSCIVQFQDQSDVYGRLLDFPLFV